MENNCSYTVAKIKNLLSKRPYAVRLDTNNVCNLNCVYCGINNSSQIAQFMTLEQFNQLAQLFFPRSKYVSLSFATEPLMSKDFHLFIGELGKYAVPNTHFITNGLLLTEKIIKSSIVSNINAITISNDAATAEMYKRIRGGSFDTLMGNLKLIQELKKEYKSTIPIVRIQFTLFDHNKADAIPFIEQYHPYFQEFYLSHLSPKPDDNYSDPILKRLSTTDFIVLRNRTILVAKQYDIKVKITFNDYQREIISGKWCSLPLSDRFIYSNGNIMMCDKKIYGNIFTEDLAEINRRINIAFGKYNPNCKVKCTQSVAKITNLDFRPD